MVARFGAFAPTRRILRLAGSILAGLLILTPAAALGHQNYSLAPNGVSPFIYSNPFTVCGNWYGENTHRDLVNGVHYNEHFAVDLCPTGGAFGKALYPIWNGLRVTYVGASEGRLDMVGTIGGQQHRLRYRHMDRIFVSVGQSVGTSTVVGTLGSRGNSTGPHLHMSAHVHGSDGLYYSRPLLICGRQIPHNHTAVYSSC